MLCACSTIIFSGQEGYSFTFARFFSSSESVCEFVCARVFMSACSERVMFCEKSAFVFLQL